MTEITEPLTWLTQEAYDRLKEELDFLSGEGRAGDRQAHRAGPRGR